MSETTELVYSQETAAPVTMAEIMAQQEAGTGVLVTVGDDGGENEDDGGVTPLKVGLFGALVAGLGLFFSRRKKRKKRKKA